MEKKLKNIQCDLVDMMEEALEKPEKVCTKELYEIMDIIKDVEETLYYHTIIHAMKEDKELPATHYKSTPSVVAATVPTP